MRKGQNTQGNSRSPIYLGSHDFSVLLGELFVFARDITVGFRLAKRGHVLGKDEVPIELVDPFKLGPGIGREMTAALAPTVFFILSIHLVHDLGGRIHAGGLALTATSPRITLVAEKITIVVVVVHGGQEINHLLWPIEFWDRYSQSSDLSR